MSTNVTGDLARLYPWQVMHYLVRGGPFDPVAQASGGPPVTTGGVLAFNSVVTLPPVPGTQTPPNIPLPRTQSMISTGTLTVTTGTLATNTGGIYIGTLPGGCWVDELEIYCYTALSGGTATSVGVFYAPAGQTAASNSPGFQPTTLFELGHIVTPAAGTVYGTRTAAANAVTSAGGLRSVLSGYQVGPGTGPTGTTTPNAQTLASLGPAAGQGFPGAKDLLAGGAQPIQGDIDLYFVNFLVAGSGTVNTAGEFAVKVAFTGLNG